MKTKRILIAAIAVAQLSAGCGGSSETVENKEATGEIRNVAITKITKSSIEDFYEATGTVKARTTTQISANMMGRIISLPAAEGDTVTRGQLLVEIDAAESRTRLEKARAALEEAQAGVAEIDRSVEAANASVKTAEASKQLADITFGRYKELYDRRSATAQEFDEARSKAQISAAELERAKAGVQVVISKRKQLNARIAQARADIANSQVYEGYSRITSPVSGVIVKKFAEAGSTAAPGVPLLSIEDNSQYRLEAAVEESRSKSVRIGGRVNVRIDAIGTDEFIGLVAKVMPSADAASRSYTVKIDLPADARLRTGLYGLARFPIAQKAAIAVPQTAIVTRGQLTGVFVLAPDGTAQFRIVTTGTESEGMVEIMSGLSEGDEIVTSDAASLTDGVRVR
ncbi:MAG: efflux RND transporter periplasmic adaptor subunit [Acidobacteriota bacterium]